MWSLKFQIYFFEIYAFNFVVLCVGILTNVHGTRCVFALLVKALVCHFCDFQHSLCFLFPFLFLLAVVH